MAAHTTTESQPVVSARGARPGRFAQELPPRSAVAERLRLDRPEPRRRHVKVIIQIPCFNEQDTLPATLADLPRAIEGVDDVELLVISDGSTDDTVAIAKQLGADHILDIKTNRGLADAFSRGLQLALSLGADIIVNTDGDNQYDAADIPRLVRPILEGRADMVIGDRGVGRVAHFSWLKRRLQQLGSRMVSALARVPIPDATSGFRAYSRDAALNMVITGTYTYTLESIMLIAHSGMAIRSVPIRSRPVERKSRLFRSIPEYLWRAGLSIFRGFLFYNPALVFVVMGVAGLIVGGSLLAVATLLPTFPGAFVLGILICGGGVTALLMSILADIINSQRRYNREILLVLRRHALFGGSEAHTSAYIRNTPASAAATPGKD